MWLCNGHIVDGMGSRGYVFTRPFGGVAGLYQENADYAG
jgi:hypothetical protein